MTVWSNRLAASIAAAAIGISLVALSEFGDVHEMRWFGALLISLGGIGLGIDAGLGTTERWMFLKRLRDWRVALAATAAAALTLPVLVALVAGLYGLVADGGHRSGGVLAGGGLTGAFLLVATLVAGALAVRAVAAALRDEPGIGEDQQPVERGR